MKHILVCGGAGYVGSHMVRCLLDAGWRVTVFDNLSTGHREAIGSVPLIEGNLLDPLAIQGALRGQAVHAVMHFAALSIVADSVADPQACYRNNVVGTLNLVDAMRQAGVDRVVFSSTAAVYGASQAELVAEHEPLAPINPYGASKMMAERVLADACSAYGLRAVALRYFNAAGAHVSGDIGEAHSPETHLIPNVLRAALNGAPVSLFGRDYPTPDGTCIRDYVHVSDLADAHLLALEYMDRNVGFDAFNLGSGQGFSVLQVLDAAREVSQRPITCLDHPRRVGDPARLVASSQRAREQLGWRPFRTHLRDIVASAWRWQCSATY